MASVEESIIHSINKNGYPDKRVSLPFQPIFKACKANDTTLSDVLKELEEQGIKNSIEGDKIVFFSSTFEPKSQGETKEFDFSNQMVQEAMKKIREMDPGELDKLKQQVEGLSEEEKKDLMEKAKDLYSKSSS